MHGIKFFLFVLNLGKGRQRGDSGDNNDDYGTGGGGGGLAIKGS